MTKSFRRVKACIIMSIFLFGVLAVFFPSSSAGIIPFESTLEIETIDTSEVQGGLRPLDDFAIVKVTLKYKIAGIGAAGVAEMLRNRGVNADITIVIGDKPSWISVSPVGGSKFSMSIYNEFNDNAYRTVAFRIKFTEDAPAHVDADIQITFEAAPIDLPFIIIRKNICPGTIPVDAKFYPIVDAPPRKTYTEITPGNTATFDIDCVNNGNALTEFVFEPLYVPDDWTVSFPSQVMVDKGSTKTIQIEVTPPYGFGYHNEQEVISVSYYGRYFATGGEEIDSDNKTIRLTVRNKGFSTPGFEAPSLLMVFAFVAIALVVIKRRKRL